MPKFRIINGISPVLSRIFPTKQQQVQNIIDIAATIPGVNKIIVFGSAVTLNCGASSDIDIAVQTADMSEDEFLSIYHKLHSCIDGPADILHYNSIVSPALLEEIHKKGVCIYDGTRTA